MKVHIDHTSQRAWFVLGGVILRGGQGTFRTPANVHGCGCEERKQHDSEAYEQMVLV